MSPTLQLLKSSARRFRRWVTPGTTILLYHRVAELPSDPMMLAVSPKHFQEHMQVLAEMTRPAALGTSRDARRRPAVAVTFDDGYADNATAALPILEKCNVPSTFFITSGMIDSNREFLWDELERLVLLADEMAQPLTISHHDKRHQWTLERTTGRGGELSETWNVCRDDDPSPRHTAFRELWSLLRPATPHDRESVLDQIRRQVGTSPSARPTHRAMTRAELIRLANHPLVTIGAHTVNHVHLASMPVEVQQQEIRQSKTDLESILGRAIETFSYPFGGRADYTPRTVSLVREAGFAYAAANVPGRAEPVTDPYQLPRLLVRDWDGDTFANHLREWFHDRAAA